MNTIFRKRKGCRPGVAVIRPRLEIDSILLVNEAMNASLSAGFHPAFDSFTSFAIGV
jgi:hypothetical protein